jgi:hypothetical protein
VQPTTFQRHLLQPLGLFFFRVASEGKHFHLSSARLSDLGVFCDFLADGGLPF